MEKTVSKTKSFGDFGGLSYDPSDLTKTELEQIVYNIDRAPYVGTEYESIGVVSRDPGRAGQVREYVLQLISAKSA
jgi:hypothetical protein